MSIQNYHLYVHEFWKVRGDRVPPFLANQGFFFAFIFCFWRKQSKSFWYLVAPKNFAIFFAIFDLFFFLANNGVTLGGGEAEGKQGKIGGEGQSGKKQGLGIKMGINFKY